MHQFHKSVLQALMLQWMLDSRSRCCTLTLDAGLSQWMLDSRSGCLTGSQVTVDLSPCVRSNAPVAQCQTGVRWSLANGLRPVMCVQKLVYSGSSGLWVPPPSHPPTVLNLMCQWHSAKLAFIRPRISPWVLQSSKLLVGSEAKCSKPWFTHLKTVAFEDRMQLSVWQGMVLEKWSHRQISLPILLRDF